MTTINYLSPIGGAGQQFFTDAGIVNSNGYIYTYLAGTTTPANTFQGNLSTSTLNSNPIQLNSLGRPSQEIWIPAGQATKFAIFTSNNIAVTPNTFDNVLGINDPTALTNTNIVPIEWVTTNLVPTYISSTVFSVPGNQTITYFSTNRRVQMIQGSTIYGTVTSQVYNSGTNVTQVTVSVDGGLSITGALSTVNTGFLNPTNVSIPGQFVTYTGIQNQTYSTITVTGSTVGNVQTYTSSTLYGAPFTSFIAGQRFNVTFQQASIGGDLFTIGNATPISLVVDTTTIATGANVVAVSAGQIPQGWNSDVQIIYDLTSSTTYGLVNKVITPVLNQITFSSDFGYGYGTAILWPTPAKVTPKTVFKITAVGGGGAGGNSGGTAGWIGQGGGAGSIITVYANGFVPGATNTITIGTGGTAGTSSIAQGGPGQATTIIWGLNTINAPGGYTGYVGLGTYPVYAAGQISGTANGANIISKFITYPNNLPYGINIGAVTLGCNGVSTPFGWGGLGQIPGTLVSNGGGGGGGAPPGGGGGGGATGTWGITTITSIIPGIGTSTGSFTSGQGGPGGQGIVFMEWTA